MERDTYEIVTKVRAWSDMDLHIFLGPENSKDPPVNKQQYDSY